MRWDHASHDARQHVDIPTHEDSVVIITSLGKFRRFTVQEEDGTHGSDHTHLWPLPLYNLNYTPINFCGCMCDDIVVITFIHRQTPAEVLKTPSVVVPATRLLRHNGWYLFPGPSSGNFKRLQRCNCGSRMVK